MTNDVKIGIKVDDGGSTAALTKEGGKLKGIMKEVADIASNIRVPVATAAARQGVTASSTPRKAAAQPGGGASDTNLSRGVAGQTGAGGRDFAAQAQGLGGLVHVYATFAANLFAVSAAFGALSKAADTSNLVKGLDQLGAQSGKSLGSLAKQIVTVTDGALSLRDAMTSTAMASAGGMTNSSILRMTEVARKASLALGRDMPDSMDRLTKGIIKIQPELLDELGIMTRVIPAQEAYARSLGKSASSLTDFEKRQAFANAVLEEGEKKFSAIKLDSNPYSKILASMQNIAQTGLELINTVLGPIVSLLASSPTALSLAMVGIGSVLLKQAIPAINQYKASLLSIADAAKETSKRSQAAAKEQYNKLTDLAGLRDTKIADSAEAEFRVAKTTMTRIQSLQDTITNKAIITPDVSRLVKKSVFDLTPADREAISSRAETLLQSDKATHIRQGTILADHIVKTDALLADSAAVHENAARNAETKDIAGQKRIQDAKKKSGDLEKIAAQDKAKTSIAETQANRGMAAALDQINSMRKDPGPRQPGADPLISKLEATSLKLGVVKAEVTSFASKLATGLGNLGPYAAAVGFVVTAFDFLDSSLSNVNKQTEEFSKALDSTTAAVDNVYRTIDALSKKDLSQILTIESIQAKANAFNELANSTKLATKTYSNLTDAWNGWDKFVDSLFDSIGKGSADKLSTTLAKSIASSIALMEVGPARKAAEDKLKNIIGNQDIDISNIKEVEKALRKLNDAELASKGEVVSSALQEISNAANNSALRLTNLKESFNSTAKIIETANAALNPTDVQSKIGTSLIQDSLKMTEALKSPIDSIIILNALLKDNNMLSILPKDEVVKLIAANKAIQDSTTSLADNEKALANTEKQIRDMKAKGFTTTSTASDAGGNSILSQEAEALVALQAQADLLVKAKVTLVKSAEETTKKFADLDKIMFVQGIADLGKGLKGAMEEGAIVAARGYLSVLKSVGGDTAAEEGKLRTQEIQVQISMVKATFEHIIAIQENSRLLTERNAQEQLNLAKTSLSTASSPRAMENASIQMLDAQHRLDVIAKERQLSGGGTKGIQVALKEQGASGTGDDVTREALKNLSPIVSQMFAMEGQLAKLVGAGAAAKLQTMAATISEGSTNVKRMLDNEIAKNNVELSSINNNITLAGIYDKNLETKRQELEEANLGMATAIATTKIASDILITEKLLASIRSGSTEESLKGNEKYQSTLIAKGKLEKDLALEQESFTKKLGISKSTNTTKEIQGSETLRKTSADRSYLEKKDTNEIAVARITSQEADLQHLKNIGAIKDEQFIKDQAGLDSIKQQLSYEAELNTLKQKGADDLALAEIKLSTAKTSGSAIAEAEATNARDSIKSSLELQISKLGILNGTKLDSIQLDAQHAALLAAQTDQMAKMVSTTESLSVVFGDLGTNIGKAGEAILKMAQIDTTYLADKKSLEEDIIEAKLANNPEKEVSLTKGLAALDKKHDSDKLKGIADSLGATKKLFAEHTLGYKLIDKAEKATHLLKIYNDNKELVMTLFNLGKKAAIELGFITASVTAEETADMAKATSKIPSVIMEFMSWLGPWGTAAAGVAIAAVLGGGGGGGGSQVDMTGQTSADRQSTQGTGQSWVGGTKTDTGGGVFGDSSAKSTSIVDSLAIMKANSIEGLDYDNKMLKALEKLAASVVGAAKSLYAVPGLRAGTGFGTSAGETSSGGFGNSIPIIGKLLSSIFGGGTSSSASITSAGLQLKGTFDQVMNDTEGSIMQYKDVLTKFHEDGGWFGSDSDWSTLSTQTQKLKAGASTAISDIFKDANALFLEIGTKTGVTAQAIGEALKHIDVSMPVDLMNLTGQALVDELNAVIGDKLSGAAVAIFTGFERYKAFGEDYLATVVRVVDANNKVDMALRSIGSSFSAISKFNISDAMIKAAGSLQTFMDQAAFFKDNFLSAAEKLAPVQKGVTDQLTKLHISTTISRNDFKKLVLAQDLGTQAGQDMYQSLIELAPGFDIVSKAVEATAAATYDLNTQLLTTQGKAYDALERTRTKAMIGMTEEDRLIQEKINLQEDANKTATLQNTLDSLSGNTSKVLLATRATELLTLSDSDKIIQKRIYLLQDEAKKSNIQLNIYNALGDTESALALTRANELKAMEDILKPYQIYLYSLQDENTIKAKLTTAYNTQSTAIKGTISSLGSSIKSLTDYKNTLMAGTTSILTPAEKYAQAKAALFQTAAAAQTSITATSTAEQISARDAAVSQLSSTSETFLAASREMYASSAQYTTDFSSVLDLLATSTDNLVTQKTTAENQLAALDSSVTFLTAIATSTDTVASLLTQYYAQQGITATAKGAIPGLAGGGIGSGITMVGERGPEIVDFKNPGRVYSNRASNDLLNTKDLVAEIKALREEVSQLRADQKEQTGHLIATNYDANNKNANTVANANDTALKQQDWKTRSQVKVA